MQRIYSVKDIKADAFLPPFFFTTRGMAIRAFTDAVNDDGHIFNAHLEDYILYELGEFDPNTGKLIAHDAPQSIGSATEFIRNPPSKP